MSSAIKEKLFQSFASPQPVESTVPPSQSNKRISGGIRPPATHSHAPGGPSKTGPVSRGRDPMANNFYARVFKIERYLLARR